MGGDHPITQVQRLRHAAHHAIPIIQHRVGRLLTCCADDQVNFLRIKHQIINIKPDAFALHMEFLHQRRQVRVIPRTANHQDIRTFSDVCGVLQITRKKAGGRQRHIPVYNPVIHNLGHVCGPVSEGAAMHIFSKVGDAYFSLRQASKPVIQRRLCSLCRHRLHQSWQPWRPGVAKIFATQAQVRVVGGVGLQQLAPALVHIGHFF